MGITISNMHQKYQFGAAPPRSGLTHALLRTHQELALRLDSATLRSRASEDLYSMTTPNAKEL
ncbi:hypothetical protein N007_17900 [Alicyclobacillus acidoterrestris ATCC 49025]|nr:hypothetical protein N007_17900 [Alicyclobacillus acidoterrestris ATCC 49025]